MIGMILIKINIFPVLQKNNPSNFQNENTNLNHPKFVFTYYKHWSSDSDGRPRPNFPLFPVSRSIGISKPFQGEKKHYLLDYLAPASGVQERVFRFHVAVDDACTVNSC